MRNPEIEKNINSQILTNKQEVAKVLTRFKEVVEPIEAVVHKMRPRPVFGFGNKVAASPELVVNILTNRKVMKSSEEEISSVRGEVLSKVTEFMRLDKPIEFCLIAFHPKSHNPIETGLRRLPDLGEMAFLKRLLDIDRTIAQVFPPGAKFTVCYEGPAFAGRFGNSSHESEVFLDQLNEFVKLLGGEAKIRFMDLSQIVNSNNDFAIVCRQEEERLRQGLEINNNTIVDTVDEFMPVMRRASVDLSDQSLRDLIAISKLHAESLGIEDLKPKQRELAKIIEQKALENAIFYVAFNETRRKLKVIENTFPDKIYISVTTKPGRLAIHAVHQGTKFLPHHGVPVLRRHGQVEIVHFQSLIGQFDDLEVVKVEDDSDNQPFFFREPRRESRIEPIPGPYGAWAT